jgi:ribosome-interacting GTPase 1
MDVSWRSTSANPAALSRPPSYTSCWAARPVTLVGSWDAVLDADEDPLALRLPTLMVVTKADQIPEVDDELAAFRELTGYGYPAVVVSVVSGHGLDQIGAFLFQHLGVFRVYTKVPGHPPDLTRPFTVRREQTVHHVAELVHKELAGGLCYARADVPGASAL